MKYMLFGFLVYLCSSIGYFLLFSKQKKSIRELIVAAVLGPWMYFFYSKKR